MADIKDQLIKDSYNYVLQSDLSTGIVYRIGGSIPINPIFSSGLTINGSLTYLNGTEQPGYVLTTDGTGYAYWSSVSGGTGTSGDYLPLSGGTVTGNTTFTSGLTSNTFSATSISATTYYGLPKDVFVTGGTYSNGTLYLTNNTGYTFNIPGFSTATGNTSNYYGSFTDTTTQVVSGANIPTAWSANTTELSNGIYITNGSRITVSNDGVYEIGYSAQIEKTQGTGANVTIWAKLNGNNIDRSSSTVTLENNSVYSLPFVSYIFDLYAGDYIEFYFSSPSDHIQITTLSGLTSPTRPVSPSLILVAKAIGNAVLSTSGDSYVSGFTLNNNTLVLSQNRIGQYSGFTVNLPYLNTSGGTITGNTIYTSGLTATTISATTLSLPLTTGSVVFQGSGGTLNQNNSQFYWDNTNTYLGLGTTTPSYKLDVVSLTGYSAVGIRTGPSVNAEINFQNASYSLPRWTIRATGAANGSSGNLTFQRLANTFPMTITSSDGVLIGTSTDAGYKLDVNGTARISSTIQSTGFFTNAANGVGITSPGTAIRISTNDNGDNIIGNGVPFFTFGNNGTSITRTTGTGKWFEVTSFVSFAPTNGNSTMDWVSITPTINQTGGASGVTRGIYINPTLTSAYDFRAIETTVGNVMLNTLSGNTLIGTTGNTGYKFNVFGTGSTGGINSNVGLNIQPVTAPIVTGVTYVLQSGSSLGVGTYYYRVTYYNSIGETSASNSISVITLSGSQVVQLNNIPTSTDTTVVGRKIYRSKLGDGSVYGALINTISNNTGTTYTDTTSDSDPIFSGNVLTRPIYAKANTTANYISVSGTRAMIVDPSLTTFGVSAGEAITVAPAVTLFGAGAGLRITYGAGNTLFGLNAGANIVGGFQNVAMGEGAMSSGVVSGSYNVGLGPYVLSREGSFNIAMGYYAGNSLTGSRNVLIGGYIGSSTSSYNDAIIIGHNATPLSATSYQINIGNTIYGRTNTGNVMIGSTTDAGYKLDVNGTARIQGDTNIINSSGASLLTLGGFNNLPELRFINTNTKITVDANSAINFVSSWGVVSNHYLFYPASNLSNTSTSGVVNGVVLNIGFAPTSGTASFNQLSLVQTINQTGGASGVTRGVYVNPTLTSAYDFRAIETTVGNVMLNTLSGNTLIGTTADTGSYKLDVSGSSRSNNFRLTDNSLIAAQYTVGSTTLTISNTGHNNAVGLKSTSAVGVHAISNLGVSNNNLLGASVYAAGGAQSGNISLGLLSNRALITSAATGMGMLSSSMLQIDSTTQGFLPPRMTSTQRDAISSPATGLTVYQTTDNYLSLFNGTNWQNIVSPNSSGNVLIGTTTDAGYKLDVNGTTRISSNLTLLGNLTNGSTGDINVIVGNFAMNLQSTNPNNGSGSLITTGAITRTDNQTRNIINVNNAVTSTAVNFNTLNGFAFTSTINQTLGTIRGVYIAPTLTSASDFRAVETTVGNVIFNSVSGNTLIGTTTDTGQKLQVSGNTLISSGLTANTLTSTGDITGFSLVSSQSSGDEGGEIRLAKPATNSTLSGTSVTIDMYQNKLRIFESGGSNRGTFIDLTRTSASVGTNLIVPRISSGVDSSGNTTSGAFTILSSVIISANTFTTGDVVSFKMRMRKSGTNGTVNYRMSANSTLNLTGSQTIGVFNAGATIVYGELSRTLIVKGATSEVFNTSITNTQNDIITSTSAVSSLSIDWTVDQYIMFNINQASNLDTTNISYYSITEI